MYTRPVAESIGRHLHINHQIQMLIYDFFDGFI